eukprot:c1610_g1_i1.p1 GENE.c1610_g1_i1~~c1610_g1_i1.p1  ORF type:complete len:208 (+),score=54.47 c1610_g1_i1:45-626(+)
MAESGCAWLCPWHCKETHTTFEVRVWEMLPYFPLCIIMVAFGPLLLVVARKMDVDADLRPFAALITLMCGIPALYLLLTAAIVKFEIDLLKNTFVRKTKLWWQSERKFADTMRCEVSEVSQVLVATTLSTDTGVAADTSQVPLTSQSLVLLLCSGQQISLKDIARDSPDDVYRMKIRILEFMARANPTQLQSL